MKEEIKIDDHVIGISRPSFIIAEISANHLKKKDYALQLIHAAKKAGADAVKLQTYLPETITIKCDNDYFKIDHGTLWDGRTLFDLYSEAFLPWEWHAELFRIAESIGITCFSSPFDRTAVDFLETFNVPAYKIASPEITDIPLIEYIASKGKPVIISTGIAEIENINEAIDACKGVGNNKIILLKCVSVYPTPNEDVNLLTLCDMSTRFNVLTGLSDHTAGITVPIAAVALGARVIEKHFTLDRQLGGVDAAFSLEPDEFSAMVKSIREAELAIGKVSYELSDKARKSRLFARSLFIVKDVKNGEIVNEENVRSIRPSYGLQPKYLHELLGKRFTSDLAKGTPLKWKHVS